MKTRARKDGTLPVARERWLGMAAVHGEAAEQLLWLADRSLEVLQSIQRGDAVPEVRGGPRDASSARVRSETRYMPSAPEPIDELLCLVGALSDLARRHQESAVTCQGLGAKAGKRGRPRAESDPLAQIQAEAEARWTLGPRGEQRDRMVYAAIEHEMARLTAAGKRATVSAAVEALERECVAREGLNSATARERFRGWRHAYLRGRTRLLRER